MGPLAKVHISSLYKARERDGIVIQGLRVPGNPSPQLCRTKLRAAVLFNNRCSNADPVVAEQLVHGDVRRPEQRTVHNDGYVVLSVEPGIDFRGRR